MGYPKKDKYTGRRNGRLVALRWKSSGVWLFKCDCGTQKELSISSVFRNNPLHRTVKSCGCLLKEIMTTGGNVKRHGMCGTKFYKSWTAMRSRCYRRHDSRFSHYGRRGIIVEWDSFEEFKKDMYPSFLRHNKKFGGRQTTLDRKDVNSNYCKSNCRWATQRTQQRNRTI